MIRIQAQIDGETRAVDRIDPGWLKPASGVTFWADFVAPTPDESSLFTTLFGFHELAIEDALSETHHPKVEEYNGYLYLILHGIDFTVSQEGFATHDTDFFLGSTYLVTVHDGSRRSIDQVQELCKRFPLALAEGPAALMHRIVDSMVDHYRPEVDELEAELDQLEGDVFDHPGPDILKRVLELKRDVSSLRRVTLPQRDVLSRLSRREFSLIPDAIVYRFRDVNDDLVRLVDQALAFQDRITTLLEAHLSNVSNQVNGIVKVLTVIATIFMPLTVLTSLYGMNVQLPEMPGGPVAQFWWIVLFMALVSGGMLWLFRRSRWL
jgi:magnesium transporter